MKSLTAKISAILILAASVASAKVDLYSLNEDGNFSLPEFHVYADEGSDRLGEASNWKFEASIDLSNDRVAVDVLTPGSEKSATVYTPSVSIELTSIGGNK